MPAHELTPVAAIADALRPIAGSWTIEIGEPRGDGWIAGTDLARADRGPLPDLLQRIGAQAGTSDRRTIAASFAMRFGWASAMAIAPYVRYGCVPDVSLDNVSFQFPASTFLQRTAIHVARGLVVFGDARASHPSMSAVPDARALLAALRQALVAQSAPVVDALFDWSGFARIGAWGLHTSSWAAHVTGLSDPHDDQRATLPILDALFAGDDDVAKMRPRFHVVTDDGARHVFQRRASCCRIYLLPQGDLCTSCPLVSDDERVARNRTFMRSMRQRTQPSRHG